MKIEQVIKPLDLKEALIALNENVGKAEVIAGGTDLLVKIREGHNKKAILIDLSDVSELCDIHETDEALEIGSAVTFSDIIANQTVETQLNGLWQACKSVGAPQIRNRGTLGGNIANASPAADSVPPLMALEAELLIGSCKDSRRVPLSQFFSGKGSTVLEENEILLKIIIPKIKQGFSKVTFEKLGLRNALAISRLSCAIVLHLDAHQNIQHAAVSTGSLGLTVMREPLMEAFLIGRKLDAQLIAEGEEQFSKVVEERLAGRSTCEFKKEAIKGIFAGAMRAWMKEAGII